MKLSKEAMLLYAVTDDMWLGERRLSQDVEAALKGGITFLQLREKEKAHDVFLSEAKEIRELAKNYGVPFVINDNVEIAMEADADGVHIGQDDGDIALIRQRIGAEKILGVSVQSVAQAIEAKSQGADYLGVGAMFPTDTKTDAIVVSKEELRAIADKVDLPICIIGGVNKNTIPQFRNSGANGAAVVSAIFGAADCTKAAAELLTLCKEVFS